MAKNGAQAAKPRAKAAIVQIAVIYLYCPHCDAPMSHPHTGQGSFTFEDSQGGLAFDCDKCGGAVRLPASAFGR